MQRHPEYEDLKGFKNLIGLEPADCKSQLNSSQPMNGLIIFFFLLKRKK
jgi:hypothetical protein